VLLALLAVLGGSHGALVAVVAGIYWLVSAVSGLLQAAGHHR